MKTIELSAAMASAPVQENLKNFAGLDAQNALGLMTPERLAAVAGEFIKYMPDGTDCDTLQETGIYYLHTRCTNVPFSFAFIRVLSSPLWKEDIVQIAYSISNGTQSIRTKDTNREWNAWK